MFEDEDREPEPRSLVPEIAGSAVTRARLQGEPLGMDRQLRKAFVWWRGINTPKRMINLGAVPLDSICHLEHTKRCTTGRFGLQCDYKRPISRIRVHVATGVILWLFGTTIGWSYLEELLGNLGYQLVRKKDLKADES